jgi:hypothetical protein
MLTHDYTYPTPHGGYCRVRIFQAPDALPVVVCTQPKDNRGESITNAAEVIAAGVLENHPDIFDTSAPGPPFVWFEHYEGGARGTPEDPATFDLVTFSYYEPQEEKPRGGVWVKGLGAPTWRRSDRATAENMTGARL